MRPHVKGHLKGHPARHCRPAGLATLPGDRVGDAIEVRVECGELGLERQALSQGGRTAQIAVPDNGVDDPTLAASHLPAHHAQARGRPEICAEKGLRHLQPDCHLDRDSQKAKRAPEGSSARPPQTRRRGWRRRRQKSPRARPCRSAGRARAAGRRRCRTAGRRRGNRSGLGSRSARAWGTEAGPRGRPKRSAFPRSRCVACGRKRGCMQDVRPCNCVAFGLSCVPAP